jgi:hypothetical protein
VNKEVNPCRGCICTTCSKSDYSGALYLCPYRSCENCEEGEYVVKRSYCDDCIPVDDEADDWRL